MSIQKHSPSELRRRIELLSLEERARLLAAVEAELASSTAESGSTRLVAYVAADTAPGLATEIRGFLEKSLPDYMVPAFVIRLDQLPLTPNGKVDRKSLPHWAERQPELERPFVAPRTPVEVALAEIWSEVLGVERVGVQDNFFELGGDSIRSVQVLAKARERGLSFTLQQVFMHRTIEALAGVAERVEQESSVQVQVFALISAEDRLSLPADVEDAYPLTRLQAGMLFHSEMSPDEALYIDVISADLQGHLDPQALRAAIREVMPRHPVLRTSFALSGFSEPLQLVHRTAEPEIGCTDLAAFSEAEAEKAILSWIREERQRGFDWRCAPLLRFHTHLRGENRFQLSLSCHHAILDGWSAASLLTELFQVYQALLEGRAPALEAPPAVRFSEFVALERQALASEESRSYWEHVLNKAVVSPLPRHSESGPAEGPSAWYAGVELQADRLDPLKELARQCGVPLKSVLLAAHLRVLALLTGQSDVITGVISNGRPEDPESERVLGLFLNTLPFPQHLPGGTWADLVRETFAAEQQWTPHRRFPLAELQKVHGGELFETAFNFTHFHVYDRVEGLGGPQVRSTISAEQTNFALTATFSLNLAGSRLNVDLVGSGSRLSREQLQAFAGYYERILESMAAPSVRYELLDLLSPEERRQVLGEWSTGGPASPGRPLHTLIAQECRAHPETVAVTAGGSDLTYGELALRAHRLAHRLRALGVGPETRVAVCMERSLDLVAALVGVLASGGAYVPIDPAYPQDRIDLMLRKSGAEVLLTGTATLRMPEHSTGVIQVSFDDHSLSTSPVDAPQVAVEPGNLAYLIFTSGSTGEPKAVGITHGSVSAFAAWAGSLFATEELDGVLAATSVCFDLSIFEIFVPLAYGGRVVLVENALSLGEISGGVRLVNTVPSVVSELLESGSLPASIQTINLAGEALPRGLADRLWQQDGVRRVLNLYGPSEDTTYSTWAEVEREGRGEPAIGRPITGTRAYVLDAHLQPLPVGTTGELFLAGAGLARGYFGDPVATALAFVPDPQGDESGGRLYRTGDLARHRPDGALEYLGRRDHQVKVRGFRIELGEIEAALRRLPTLRDAVVLALRDADGRARLVAWVVPAGAAVPDPRELRDALRSILPEHMLPSAFIPLERLPFTATGKLDRRALQAPEGGALTSRREHLGPRTPAEEIIAGIWADLLRLDPVGVHDNFFELGGHSLLAIQAVSRVREAFGIELPLRTLFQVPTVAALAEVVDAAVRAGAGVGAPPIVAVSRDASLPLSFAQERLWFLDHLAPESPYYNVPSAVHMQGRLDVHALAAALSEVVRRHEVLRTVYGLSDGHPIQRVLSAPDGWLLPVVDLQGLPEGARRAEVLVLAEQEARRPFNLSSGPVVRATLVLEGPGMQALLLTLHHIASDFWSAGILTRELMTLYSAFTEGQPSPLPLLAIQYADYAAWERSWLSGEVLEKHLDHWRDRLAGAPPLLELPSDRPRPPFQTFRGRREPFHLTQEASEALRTLARREQATLFMALLAAFQVLLQQAAGRDDIVVGTDVANRARLETEGLIGFFVNQLVLRTDLSGDPTFKELLARVREVTLDAYTHQELPFDRLVDAVRPERELSYAPIFQVKLVLQNATVGDGMQIPGLSLSLFEVEKGTAQLDLVLNLEDAKDGISGGLEYNADLFERETILDLLADFEALLHEIIRRPGARLVELRQAMEAARAERKEQAEAAIRQSLGRRFQQARRGAVTGS